MNVNTNPTPEQLRDLIRECDDSAGNHVLWVKKTGEVKLSAVPVNQTPDGFERDHPDMQIRFETFLAGNEYVGPDAARDDEWIAELLDRLLQEWSRAKGRPEVLAVDPAW
jgi:hypothetical protein